MRRKVLSFIFIFFLFLSLFSNIPTFTPLLNKPLDISTLPYETLSSTEINSIMMMREEEKLARDVYLTLYDAWNIQIFYNIATRAEQIHMDSVKNLIDKYKLDDPVKDDTIGIFTDERMQKLYYDLVTLGMKSEIDALKVGATIEDLDIYDLDNSLKETDNQDIKLVYENLIKGSENHMRAFINTLKQYEASYEPQFITMEEFQRILNSTNTMQQNNSQQYKGGKK
ncbi:hypothetical protein SAMN02745164_01072 [Marinitoga hydrogenitolerans DSM 16785]|uniref:DUF2202 domain-containing protein n=1 Tax=Marinitoga hydrogenitolerans (strain DSM 16785 / JCM 12826 / AT1271) TaxID=1122195 RepID=A0A1M4W3F5_MARH1|nr:DUF2202 domain-containing protein [Marinitoga hydrogenitolerans]SHE75768.1 hypothetical protein SAMN02745164_01072 [Marinitoga hydrogenitolerans DSM 16785]